MAIANRYSVNFALISLLGPLTAIGLIIAAMATTFLTIDKLNTNPTVWVCLGVVCFLLGCFICFSYLMAKRLNPFEYDSDHLYFYGLPCKRLNQKRLNQKRLNQKRLNPSQASSKSAH